MNYRTFARTGWAVSEIGYGTWGMGSWTGSSDSESGEALAVAQSHGCNFFDTAWAYGEGHSEQLLARHLRFDGERRPILATKVPPKNLRWPAKPEYPLADVFPADHIRDCASRSRKNLGVDSIDLLQLHVWSDTWADEKSWQSAVEDLKSRGVIGAFGISVNRREPGNVVRALRTGLVDSVQVVYNIFDQAPEDELFPACLELGVAVIARVPFDEGSLTGALSLDSRWPEGDWRNLYFNESNLRLTLDRVEKLRTIVPAGMDLPELALRFILQHPAVTATIPGMRRVRHVQRNLAVSDSHRLDERTYNSLRAHRWDR
jgi:aryl-alcohol dehydrogenase-like predicted oxidoreductase